MLSLSGLFIAVALTYTGGLQGTGDTKSPLYISIISQVVVPLGICFVIQRDRARSSRSHIWIAILIGHVTRCALSVIRFNQGKWRTIKSSECGTPTEARAPRHLDVRTPTGASAEGGASATSRSDMHRVAAQRGARARDPGQPAAPDERRSGLARHGGRAGPVALVAARSDQPRRT